MTGGIVSNERAAEERQALFEALARPLLPYLRDSKDRVIEIVINEPGRVMVELEHHDGGSGWEAHKTPEITRDWIDGFAVGMGQLSERRFSPKRPVLGCSLPGGHRLQVMTGANVTSGVALAIRVKRRKRRDLASFGLDDKAIARIGTAMREGATIMILGGTGAGKTTLMNLIIRDFFPRHLRPIILEDVDEIDIPADLPNYVHILLSRWASDSELTYEIVLDSVLRLRPDQLFCGELSIHNAAAMYRVLNTGHKGLCLTAHSNSGIEGLEAWRRNYELATGRDAEAIVPYLAKTVDLVVHVTRGEDNSRRTTVETPAELDWRSILGRGMSEEPRAAGRPPAAAWWSSLLGLTGTEDVALVRAIADLRIGASGDDETRQVLRGAAAAALQHLGKFG